MRIAMQTNLVPGISHGFHLFWERLEAMPRNKPGGFDVVFVEEFKQSLCANGASKYALSR
jgi:hypothetical protein